MNKIIVVAALLGFAWLFLRRPRARLERLSADYQRLFAEKKYAEAAAVHTQMATVAAQLKGLGDVHSGAIC